MFYKFIRELIWFILFIFNGRATFHHLDRIPNYSENYILIAPHRMAWEPVWFAFGTRPKQFIFMAKKELFKNPINSWWLRKCGAFPVDRVHPDPRVLKYAVKMLKSSNKSLIMFPSGTRHSSEMKGGVTVIAKLAKVRLVPVVYQGPLGIKGVLKRQRVHINFGKPIDISDIKKANAEGIAETNRRIEEAFEKLDKEIDPDFHYEAGKKSKI